MTELKELDSEIFGILLNQLMKRDPVFLEAFLQVPKVSECMNDASAGFNCKRSNSSQAEKLRSFTQTYESTHNKAQSVMPDMNSVSKYSDMEVSQSMTSTLHQRPQSTSFLSQKSANQQAVKITQRQLLDQDAIQNSIQKLTVEIDGKMKRLQDLKKQIKQREKIFQQVNQGYYKLKQAVTENTDGQTLVKAQISQQKTQQMQLHEEIQSIKRKIQQLVACSPDIIHIQGNSITQQVESLFKKLINNSKDKIFIASKQSTLRVYEQDVSIEDARDLGKEYQDLLIERSVQQLKLIEVQNLYHQKVLQK